MSIPFAKLFMWCCLASCDLKILLLPSVDTFGLSAPQFSHFFGCTERKSLINCLATVDVADVHVTPLIAPLVLKLGKTS